MCQVQNTCSKHGRGYNFDGFTDYRFLNQEFRLVDVELKSGVADMMGCHHAIFVECVCGYGYPKFEVVLIEFFSCAFSGMMSSLLALLVSILVFFCIYCVEQIVFD